MADVMGVIASGITAGLRLRKNYYATQSAARAKRAVVGIRQIASQSVPYAATIAIDPTQGAVVNVAPLTGPLTIAPPVRPQPGDTLAICLEQDATGGRAVTWDAIFVNPPSVDTTALARTVGTFVYADGVWQ